MLIQHCITVRHFASVSGLSAFVVSYPWHGSSSSSLQDIQKRRVCSACLGLHTAPILTGTAPTGSCVGATSACERAGTDSCMVGTWVCASLHCFTHQQCLPWQGDIAWKCSCAQHLQAILCCIQAHAGRIGGCRYVCVLSCRVYSVCVHTAVASQHMRQ